VEAEWGVWVEWAAAWATWSKKKENFLLGPLFFLFFSFLFSILGFSFHLDDFDFWLSYKYQYSSPTPTVL
jgi:hypothetical protein